MMEFRQIQYLLTLAEYRNFTKASKALYISQPTLSAYVAKVEGTLGVTLFDRSTTPLTLTYAGEVFVKGAEEVLDACKRLDKQLSDISAQKLGRIRIAMSSERAAYMIPRILPKYQEMYPKVTVEIVSSICDQIVDVLLDNRVDIAILPDGEFNKQEVIENDIYSDELVLVARDHMICEEYLIDGIQDAVDISQLENIPLILLNQQNSNRSFVDTLFSNNGVCPSVTMETDSLTTAYRLATAGLGAAIVPRMILELTKETERTPVYSLGACGMTWKIVALQRKDRYISQIEKDFIMVARQTFLSQ